MNYGFVKVAAAVPHVKVADCFYNIQQIEELMRQASQKEVQIIAFPELSVTSYTCMDLFSQETLLRNAEKALLDLVNNTADLDLLTIVGCPLVSGSQLINAAVAFQRGEILGVVPKSYLPSYKEFQEERWFTASSHLQQSMITIGNREVPLDCYLIFEYDEVRVGIEICEDLWVPIPPSSELAMQGANLIFNLSASNELIGKHAYLRSLICQQSARCIAGYVYASAGFGESSTDLVFAGNGIIAENGTLLRESERFSMEEQLVISEIDIQNLQNDRRINTSFMQGYLNHNMDNGTVVSFSLPNRTLDLTRAIDPHPFTPSGDALKERCEEIFHIQVAGLAKRVLHAHAQTAVVGISGGLDSTLALLVTVMTIAQSDIPAAILRDFGIMCHKDECTSFLMQFLKQDKYLKRGTGVEVSGCFVRENHGRIVYQCACDGNALHLSSGHLIGFVFQTVAQPHSLQRFDSTAATFGSTHGRVVHKRQFDILHSGRFGQQIVTLEHEPDLTIPQHRTLRFAHRADGNIIEQILSACRGVQTAQYIKERRLSRTGSTHDGDKLPFIDSKRNAPQRMNGFVPHLKVPFDILYFNYSLHDCHLLFLFLLSPGRLGMNGLLSPPLSLLGAAPTFSPGIAPMIASDTTLVPSVMPLTISVDMPLLIPISTG